MTEPLPEQPIEHYAQQLREAGFLAKRDRMFAQLREAYGWDATPPEVAADLVAWDAEIEETQP